MKAILLASADRVYPQKMLKTNGRETLYQQRSDTNIDHLLYEYQRENRLTAAKISKLKQKSKSLFPDGLVSVGPKVSFHD